MQCRHSIFVEDSKLLGCYIQKHELQQLPNFAIFGVASLTTEQVPPCLGRTVWYVSVANHMGTPSASYADCLHPLQSAHTDATSVLLGAGDKRKPGDDDKSSSCSRGLACRRLLQFSIGLKRFQWGMEGITHTEVTRCPCQLHKTPMAGGGGGEV